MNMMDMSAAIEPKSDQLNADNLISGPLTITVTDVKVGARGQEQPVSIHFEGDNGKPYKPCKSMARVMVAAWGRDGNAYVGKSMTLYRDPTVTWAGMAVGGIRISHMSDINKPMSMALTANKKSRQIYTVEPLKVERKTAKIDPEPKTYEFVRPSDGNRAQLDPDTWRARAEKTMTAIIDAGNVDALLTFDGFNGEILKELRPDLAGIIQGEIERLEREADQ